MRFVFRALLFFTGCAIVGMWFVSAAANFAHAYQMAGDSEYRHIFAGASVGADVLKAAAFVAVFAALRTRAWDALVAALIVWTITTGWSLRSLLGFSSTMLTVTRATQETDSAIKKSTHEELQLLLQQQAWMRQQTAGKVTGADKSERGQVREERETFVAEARRLEERVDKLRSELRKQSAVAMVDSKGLVDPSARFLVGYMNMPAWTYDVATVLGFLLLVEICSNLCGLAFKPIFGDHIDLPIPEPPQAQVIPPPPPVIPIAHRDGEANLIKVQRQRAAGREVPVTLRAQAEVFLGDVTAAYGAKTVVSAAEVLNLFPAWAEREGVAQPTQRNLLAQQLIRVGVHKVEGGGYRLP